MALCLTLACSAAAAAQAQPPDATPQDAIRQWERVQQDQEAAQRRTPAGTLSLFAQGLSTGDLVLASRSVEGAHVDGDLRKLQISLQKQSRQPALSLAPLFAGAQGEEFEARVIIALRVEGPLEDDALLASKATLIERVTLRHAANGDWKIVPRQAPEIPLAPTETNLQAQTEAAQAIVKLGQDEADGWLNAWARALAQPRRLVVRSVSQSSMSNVKQVLLGAMQFAQDYDAVFAFKPENFEEKLQPYVKNRAIFLAPTLDEDKPFAYTLNPAIAGQNLGQLKQPAQTVAIYEAGPDGKLLFRFDGRALIGFADGHVKLVTPEEAEKLIWKP